MHFLCAMQASAYNRWRSADVVCHELGHQWFGNYVTCSDWSNVAGGRLSWFCNSCHLPHLADHGRWAAHQFAKLSSGGCVTFLN